MPGVELAAAEISVSPEFEDLHPGVISKTALDLVTATKPRAVDLRPDEVQEAVGEEEG